MEVLSHLMIVVEALVEVDFAIAIQVVEFHNLIATADKHCAVTELQPKRLEQPRGNPLPCETRFRFVEPAHEPDVAVPRTDRHPFAVRVEVEPREPELCVPGIAF